MTGGGSARDPLSRVAAKTTNAAPKSQSGSRVAGRRKRNDAAASAAGRRTRIAPEVIGPLRPYENEAAAACERTVRIGPHPHGGLASSRLFPPEHGPEAAQSTTDEPTRPNLCLVTHHLL